MVVVLVFMIALMDDVPKFGSKERFIKAKRHLTNTDIRVILEKSVFQAAKAIDGYCNSTIYKVRREYKLIDGDLYRKVEDGS